MFDELVINNSPAALMTLSPRATSVDEIMTIDHGTVGNTRLRIWSSTQMTISPRAMHGYEITYINHDTTASMELIHHHTLRPPVYLNSWHRNYLYSIIDIFIYIIIY